jgi:hypothetical protein
MNAQSNKKRKLYTTKETAAELRRAEQTLRVWAMNDSGPISPVRLRKGGPLLWRRSDIEKLINGEG